MKNQKTRKCQWCRLIFEGRANQLYCSPTCNKRMQRYRIYWDAHHRRAVNEIGVAEVFANRPRMAKYWRKKGEMMLEALGNKP